jgi:hypothetical protein
MTTPNPHREAGPDWAAVRHENICLMVETGQLLLWADGCQLLTCGAHTGHTVQPVAFCQDATWAEAIAGALEKIRGESA